MERSKQLQETLKLGKRIVQVLELERESDILSRWMAHYLAEKIELAEIEKDIQKKESLNKECSELIIKLWDRRKVQFDELNPLNKLRSTLEVLRVLKKREPHFWEIPFRNTNKGPLADFASVINKSGYRIIQITLMASLLPDKILKAKEWKENFSELLSKEEIEVIEKLDSYLDSDTNDNSGLKFIVQGQEENQENLRADEIYLHAIIEKLDALLIEQKEALEKVKEKLLG